MGHLDTAVSLQNGAIRKISNGTTRRVAMNKSIKQVAAENTSAADNSDAVNSQIEENSKMDERRILWYSLGISIVVVGVLFAAMKFKLIKL